jgi:hypothetical protein
LAEIVPRRATQLDGPTHGVDVTGSATRASGPTGRILHVRHTRCHDTVTGESFDGDDQRHTPNVPAQRLSADRREPRWRVGSNFPLVGFSHGHAG